jgi:bifunctional non-homologous end joining protein LigD
MAHDVRLTSPDRVLFPDDGITKGDLFAYYERIAPTLVPHLRDRPFTMKRYREGIAGDGFFQKQAPKGMPSWIPTKRFETHPRGGGSRLVDFPLVNSPEALLWMVQIALHRHERVVLVRRQARQAGLRRLRSRPA